MVATAASTSSRPPCYGRACLFLDADNERRRAIVAAYASGIRHPSITVLPPAGERSVAHLAVVRSPLRDALRSHLTRHGIACDVHYPIPDHRQPVHASARPTALPVTERACAEVLSLPCFPGLSDDELRHVVDTCNAFVA